MANIHNSKDVLKNTKPLFPIHAVEYATMPISGLYITGVHRPPHYIDHTFTILDMSSTSATIDPYTTTTDHITPGDYATAWQEFKEEQPISITHYTTTTDHITPGDYATAWQEFKEEQPLEIDKYTCSQYAIPPGLPTLCIKAIDTVVATIV